MNSPELRAGRVRVIAIAAIATMAPFGCYSAMDGMPNGQPGPAYPDGPGAGGPDGSPPGANPAASGLPCDISATLQRYCIGCHSSPPVASAPMALLRYEDLIATRGNPPRAVAERALERMREGSMPPSPLVGPTAAELSAFESWVNAGLPRSTCSTAADAGRPAPNPYETPLQCSSGRYWRDDDDESPEMHPGRACIACHSQDDEGPRLTIGGTVYRTAHEPDDCNGGLGASERIVVQITDANGMVIELTVNRAGNFLYEGSVALPYSAKVIAGGKERAMPPKQTSGDCNSCHTVNGTNGAPGRIMAP